MLTTVSPRLRLGIAAGVIAATAVAAGIGWGLATGGDRTDQAAPPGPTASGTSPSRPTPDQASLPAPAPPAGQPGGGQPADPPPPPPPAPAGPVIERFRVTQEPLCSTEFPFHIQPLVLEWQVTGTDSVTLSIDGQGVYDTYPAEDSDTFSNFTCTGSEGSTERHTYLLTATGAGQTVTEQLVVEAVVQES